MDPRCPRQMERMPGAWCSLAVLRLKAIRNAGRELTELEESQLPGCPWAISHQLSNYCFFKYMNEYGEGNSASDIEIASMLHIEQETVKKTEKNGITKLKAQKEMKELKELLGTGESVLEDRPSAD